MRKSNFDDTKSSNTKAPSAKTGGKRVSKRSKRSRSNNDKYSSTDYNAEKAVSGSTNDPAWYSQSPELLRDAASIPFSWPTGTKLINENFLNPRSNVVPGVMTIGMVPAIGTATQKTDPVNVASDAIYSFVRHANSGHSNYDAPDLMMYLLAISSVYSFITWCQRLLGLVMLYDQRNRYLPDILLRANKVQPNDLRNNISNFRFWLNTFISKVASFAVPNVMPYFSRMAFLYSNYYIDGPSIKDQLYMYVPEGITFPKFEIDSETGLGRLRYVGPQTTLASVSEIMEFGDSLFNAIWEQEDFGIMSGDILKAYGANIIKLSPVPELFILQPVYDPMFLHQFKNAKIHWNNTNWIEVGSINVMSSGVITQTILINGENLDYAGQGRAVMNLMSADQILSSDFDNPTPEVVIESTRLMPYFDSDDSHMWFYCGSEMPLTLKAWLVNINSGAPYEANLLSNSINSVITTRDAAAVDSISISSNFKYAPEILFAKCNSTSVDLDANSTYRFWDIDNYAILSPQDLHKMHQTALMSMLAVPSIAKVN